MDILLLAGLWLPATVWDGVAAELTGLGHRPVAVRLPGVDDRSPATVLDDQLAAALEAVDAATRPLVVGHSAASTLAWLVADRRPTALAGVVMIGGFPTRAGAPYADFFPVVDGAMAFPGWDVFEGPDTVDLDDAARAHLSSIAVPVPAGVATAPVVYADERRRAVPVTLVCPEFDPAQARAWIAAGDVPELAGAEHVAYVDIESGHWPMHTRPAELARVLDAIANGRVGEGA